MVAGLGEVSQEALPANQSGKQARYSFRIKVFLGWTRLTHSAGPLCIHLALEMAGNVVLYCPL
jgi:hypothetical protein